MRVVKIAALIVVLAVFVCACGATRANLSVLEPFVAPTIGGTEATTEEETSAETTTEVETTTAESDAVTTVVSTLTTMSLRMPRSQPELETLSGVGKMPMMNMHNGNVQIAYEQLCTTLEKGAAEKCIGLLLYMSDVAEDQGGEAKVVKWCRDAAKALSEFTNKSYSYFVGTGTYCDVFSFTTPKYKAELAEAMHNYNLTDDYNWRGGRADCLYRIAELANSNMDYKTQNWVVQEEKRFWAANEAITNTSGYYMGEEEFPMGSFPGGIDDDGKGPDE